MRNTKIQATLQMIEALIIEQSQYKKQLDHSCLKRKHKQQLANREVNIITHIHYLTNLNPSGVILTDKQGRTLLHIAAQHNYIKPPIQRKSKTQHAKLVSSRKLKLQIDHKIKLLTQSNHEMKTCMFNYQDDNGNTPLHTAIQHDNLFFASQLISHTNLTLRNNDNQTPLQLMKSNQAFGCYKETHHKYQQQIDGIEYDIKLKYQNRAKNQSLDKLFIFNQQIVRLEDKIDEIRKLQKELVTDKVKQLMFLVNTIRKAQEQHSHNALFSMKKYLGRNLVSEHG